MHARQSDSCTQLYIMHALQSAGSVTTTIGIADELSTVQVSSADAQAGNFK